MTTALVTGVTGQTGSHCVDFLLQKGINVIGAKRRSSTINTWRLDEALKNPAFILEECDLCDPISMDFLLCKYKPDYLFNYAGQSHVHTSFGQPSFTFQVNALGVQYLLDIIRTKLPTCKFITANSSEMFGGNYTEVVVNGKPIKQQNLETEFYPNSPYACSKLVAHHLTRLYREAYGLYCCSAINFNHSGNRRGDNFVSRKITKYVARLYCESKKYYELGKSKPTLTSLANIDKLKLGNIESFRDWSYAPDIVRGMWLMLQQDKPQDYILCSGQCHSVKEFLKLAFEHVGIKNYMDFIEIDPSLYRPAEVDYLCGDNTRAKNDLGWSANVTFDELVKLMVDNDIAEYSKNKGL